MDSSNKDKGVWPSDKLPFTWAWAPMDLVFNNETSSNRKLKQKKYLPEGRIAVIDQGQELVGGYTDDDNIAFTGELPVIIFGDHTRCVKYIDFPFAQGADGVKVLSPTSLVDPKFSYYSLLTLSLPDKGYSRHFKFLKETQFPIPPLPEQKRIAKKIDALQARSSGARKVLEAIPPLLEKFRQSVLASAFRGDLTADWRAQNPDIEPAEKLLERIRKERRKSLEENELAKMKAKGKTPKDDKWKKKYKEPEPVDTTDLPELPEAWCWAAFEELYFYTQNGISKRNSSSGSPTNVLRLADIENSRISDFNSRQIKLTDSEIEQYLLKHQDIICIRVNGSKDLVAKLVLFNSDTLWTFCDHFIRFRLLLDYVEAGFIVPLFNSEAARNYIQNHMVSSAGQNTISQASLRRLPVPLPPREEQKIISLTIETYYDFVGKVGEIVAKESKRLSTLDQSILSKAFRGKLVPQDPNDEPASQLLERIKQKMIYLEAGTEKGARKGRNAKGFSKGN